MTKNTLYLLLLCTALLVCHCSLAQPEAGRWKTWFVSSGKDYRLPAPASYKPELSAVLSAQQSLGKDGLAQIVYWNAGSPGYRWQNLMASLWQTDTAATAVLAQMLLSTAIYDATVAAWDSKYAYNRPRPFAADKRIRAIGQKPETPSYPCEHSVAAGVAVAVFSKYYPKLADSVAHMAERLMASRVTAGLAFPSDTQAGFELGKRIAENEMEATKDFLTTERWDGKIPSGQQHWRGRFAMFPTAGKNKTVVLQNAAEFRPAPPPDFAKDMEELKTFKRNFRSNAAAYYYASQNFNDELLNKKIFEYNLNTNPPLAARLYAATAIGYYDTFASCWDAKYAYWGIRPDQYDTTYKALIPTPPFPGYPSGHAAMCGMMSELFSYFFPADEKLFRRIAKEGAESRFQAGIHFRTDNEVGLTLGQNVGKRLIDRLKRDGADNTESATGVAKAMEKK